MTSFTSNIKKSAAAVALGTVLAFAGTFASTAAFASTDAETPTETPALSQTVESVQAEVDVCHDNFIGAALEASSTGAVGTGEQLDSANEACTQLGVSKQDWLAELQAGITITAEDFPEAVQGIAKSVFESVTAALDGLSPEEKVRHLFELNNDDETVGN